RQASRRKLEIDALGGQALVELALRAGEKRRLRERAREKRLQAWLAGDEAATGEREKVREAGGEHDLVAQALLAGHEQRAPGKARAAPARILEALVQGLHCRRVEACLVFLPAACVVAAQQVD